MKKLLIAVVLATAVSSANAMATNIMHRAHPVHTVTPAQTYQNGYSTGYHAGKNNAYNHVAKTAFIVGAVVVAGIIVYELGKESRWGVNQDGNITYRF